GPGRALWCGTAPAPRWRTVTRDRWLSSWVSPRCEFDGRARKRCPSQAIARARLGDGAPGPDLAVADLAELIPFASEYPLGYIYQRATRRSPRKAENNEERRPRVPTEDRQSPQAGPRSTRRRHRTAGARRLMPRRRHAAVGRVDGARSRRLPHRVHGHEELPRRPRGGRDGRRSAHRRRAREALPHPRLNHRATP